MRLPEKHFEFDGEYDYTYKDMCQTLRVKDDTSQLRTVHKAKSAEFDNVLVIVENEVELGHIIKPSVESVEDDSRIYYVALSRAKNHLHIAITELGDENRKLVEALGIEIKEL